MAVLSVSSQVIMGHVGNSASAFALQRLGHEVWPVPTIVLSHHPGHGKPAGYGTPSEVLDAMLGSVVGREPPEAWFSGYLASAEQGHVIADRIAAAKAQNPDLLYVLDPVIGDTHSGQYVPDAVAAVIRDRLLPLATCVLPNRFELGFLSGAAEDASEAMARLRQAGPRVVVLTSAPADSGRTAVIASGTSGRFRVEMSAIPDAPHGTGDLFSGVFLARLLDRMPLGEAIGHAAGAVHAVVGLSRALQMNDLALTAGQHALSAPPVLPEIKVLET